MPSELKMEDLLDAKPIRELSDAEAIVRVQSDYEKAKSEKADDLARAERYRNIYMALDSPEEAIDESTGEIEDDESMYSNTYMPVGAAIVDSAVTKLFNLFFSTSNYMEIDSDDWNDGFMATKITAHLLKRHREMKFKNIIYRTLQEACCYDYAVTGTRWLLEDGFVPKVVREEEITDLGVTKMRRQTMTQRSVYVPDKVDRSDVIRIPYKRCYHDWSSIDGLNDSRFFIDDKDVTLEELMMNSKLAKPWGKYENIGKVIRANLLGVKDKMEGFQTEEERKEFVNNRRVTRVRYWTKDHVIEFAEGYIIRRMDIYGWPIQIWKVFELPDQFAGMGFLQRLERSQLDINAAMNSRRDYQNLVARPFGVIDRELIRASDGAPRLYPGKVFESTGGDATKKLYIYQPGGNVNQDSMTDVQAEIGMMEKTSGIGDPVQGAVSKGRTTATEIDEVVQSAEGRLNTVAIRMEEECLEVIYLNQFFLEQANLTRREAFKYYGPHGDETFVIDPSNYMWNSVPRFTAKGTRGVIEGAMSTQQFLLAMDRAMMVPQVQHNWQNIMTELWRRLSPKDYNNFINDPSALTYKLPPALENMLMSQGHRVQVSPQDNTGEHLQTHKRLKTTPDYHTWPRSFQMILDAHIQETEAGGAAAGPSAQPMGGAQDSSDPARGLRVA